jgi:integrase
MLESSMPTRKLTDLFVDRVKPPAKGRDAYFDASTPGLALRVTPSGAKSWCLFYRLNGRQRLFTIGPYPPIKPAQARREAQTAFDRVQEGFDPADEKRARRDMRTPELDTFGAVAHDYLERHLRANRRPSTYAEAKRDLDHDALPKWRMRPIASIGDGDVIKLIDAIVARGAGVMANRTLARLRALFRWAVQKKRLKVSPADGIRLPTEERARDRVLNDDELRWFWKACVEIGPPFGPLCRLLLLTAQRRDEVGAMTWAEIDLHKKTWVIPRHRSKNDREHEVQLSAAAMAVLQSIARTTGDGLVFTTTGATPVSGFSKAKARLDAAMLAQKGAAIPEWTLHDLRRTATSGMARLNFPPHVVDKILNHAGGTISGVAAVYNRHAYLDERRAALEAWGRYIESLIVPRPGNVVAPDFRRWGQ